MTKLFDLSDTSDLPFKTVDQRKADTLGTRLLETMPEAGEPVSITQIRAALYRKYKKNYMPKPISARMAEFVKQGLAKRTGSGVYGWTITKKPELKESVNIYESNWGTRSYEEAMKDE